MFQRGDIEQALHHFKQLFSKKPGIFTLNKLNEWNMKVVEWNIFTDHYDALVSLTK